MGGGAEPEEPSRYGPSNLGLMAPEDQGPGAASPGAALPKTPAPIISVPAVPCEVPSITSTPIANVTIGRQRTTRANKVRLLSSEHHISQVQGSKTWEAGTTYVRSQHHIDIGKAPAGKTKDETSWVRAPHPRCLTRTTPQSRAQWHRWPAKAREPTRLRISKSFMHHQIQTRVPNKTEHTSVRPNYGSGLDTPPTFARGHFTQEGLAGIPACQPKRSPGGGRISGGGGEHEGRKLPRPPPHPLRTLTQKGFPPPTPSQLLGRHS
jgi:hypothetical protein